MLRCRDGGLIQLRKYTLEYFCEVNGDADVKVGARRIRQLAARIRIGRRVSM